MLYLLTIDFDKFCILYPHQNVPYYMYMLIDQRIRHSGNFHVHLLLDILALDSLGLDILDLAPTHPPMYYIIISGHHCIIVLLHAHFVLE